MDKKSKITRVAVGTAFVARHLDTEGRHNQSHVRSLELASMSSEMSSTSSQSPLILKSSARSPPHRGTTSHLLRLQRNVVSRMCTPANEQNGAMRLTLSNRLLVMTRGLYPLLAWVPIRRLHLLGVLALGFIVRYRWRFPLPALCLLCSNVA